MEQQQQPQLDIPVLIEKVKQAALDLEENGYAVIPELFGREECERLCQRMWAHWANLSDNKMTPNEDYAQWYATQLPAHKHGIIESWGLNHLDLIREIRRDPRLLWCYALLYGTDQLTASMDRINFKFPSRRYKSKAEWPHTDQHPAKAGRVTIQAYLTLMDCKEDSPGNRFYEGSHAIFSEFFKEKSETLGKTHWNTLTEEEQVALPKRCPLVKPTYRAGSLVLWDSRTAHSPDDGAECLDGRFVVYVCYNKLWEASEDESFWAKKKSAFIDCRATNHSPVPMTLFAKCPRLYDRKEKGPYDEIPREKLGLEDPSQPKGAERYLFGFERYENQEGKLLGDAEWKEKYGVEETIPLLEFVSPFDTKSKRKNSTQKKPKKQSHKKSRTVVYSS